MYHRFAVVGEHTGTRIGTVVLDRVVGDRRSAIVGADARSTRDGEIRFRGTGYVERHGVARDDILRDDW